ncbi:hypothetical protein HCUR_00499 [Holospora curviuscula]|uniref:Uncharacterized protein n=1 Tax=Holospora curviuscula TaxID=1082868 RepID=A0A2S5R9G8_9PROT|nr:hypothetical protein HCUR_00499 [Holospora curviuscula]
MKRDIILIKELHQDLRVDYFDPGNELNKKITNLLQNQKHFTSEEMDTLREIEKMMPHEATLKVVDNIRRLIKIFMNNFSTMLELLNALLTVEYKAPNNEYTKKILEQYQNNTFRSLKNIQDIKNISDKILLTINKIEEDVKQVKM